MESLAFRAARPGVSFSNLPRLRLLLFSTVSVGRRCGQNRAALFGVGEGMSKKE